MGTFRSKSAIAVLAAGLAMAPPISAQQNDEGAPLGQLIDSVRGFFGRIFSGAEQKPAATETPVAPPSPAQAPAADPVPAPAPKPEMQAASRNLHEAVVNGDIDAVRRLLEQGADIEAKDPGSGASPLHYAVMKGRMQVIDLLLSRNADVNSRTRNGTTPLHTAALYARLEVAERLIELRADINAVSAGGSTPLALATAARNKPIAELLRARGAK
jgi:hypothetical protein